MRKGVYKIITKHFDASELFNHPVEGLHKLGHFAVGIISDIYPYLEVSFRDLLGSVNKLLCRAKIKCAHDRGYCGTEEHCKYKRGKKQSRSNCGITSKLLRSKMAATDIEPAAIMIKRTNIIRMNRSDFSDFGDLIFLAPPCIRDRERS